METEAKIRTTSVAPPKGKFLILQWDRSKYRIAARRLGILMGVVFTFYAGYSFLLVIMRTEGIEAMAGNSPFMRFDPVESMTAGEKSSLKKNKRGAVRAVKFSGPEVIARAGIGIPPGTSVRVKLLTGGSNGPVKAQILDDVYVGGDLAIAHGNILLGNGASTEERLYIRFDRMVSRAGEAQSIQADAYDPDDKIVGLKGSTVGGKTSKLAAAIGLGFLGGMTEGLQEQQVQGGVAVKTPSLKNAALNGATYAALDQSREAMSSVRNQVPIIEIEANRICVAVFEGK